MALISKVLPTTLVGDPNQPLYTLITRTIVDPVKDAIVLSEDRNVLPEEKRVGFDQTNGSE
jgi:hypothetical protein